MKASVWLNNSVLVSPITIHVGPEINLHNIIIAQHSLVTSIRCVMCRDVVQRAACGEPNTLQRVVNIEIKLRLFGFVQVHRNDKEI